MSLWIEWETEEVPEAQRESWAALFEKTVAEALRHEEVDTPCEVSLTVTLPEEIRALNRDYRETDRVTDVLSFPQWDYEGQPAASFLKNCEVDPDTNEVCLGDIVICLERAKEQAADYGHSLERELGFLCAHSMLHLLGYDHMVPEEEKEMFARQEEILQAIGLTRDI